MRFAKSIRGGGSVAAKIVVAEHAGACYGVERALKLARHAGEAAGAPVHTLGPLIHNPLVVRDLEAAGVELAETLDDAREGTLIIRTHGVVPEVIEGARGRGLEVLDATCPYVKKVHEAAAQLVAEGYQLLVIGEAGHPEVEGILGHAGSGAQVVSEPEELDAIKLASKVGVVVQTTQTAARLAEVTSALVGRVRELRVVNTICKATGERQRAAAELAAASDCMVVVGGKNSGNTRRLAEICSGICARTHHIESEQELDAAWFAGACTIGITAGASTPQAHIDRVRTHIEELVDAS